MGGKAGPRSPSHLHKVDDLLHGGILEAFLVVLEDVLRHVLLLHPLIFYVPLKLNQVLNAGKKERRSRRNEGLTK